MRDQSREKKHYYPICVKLNGKRCLVAGGGAVAERKVANLIKTGAAVTVISPTITATLRKMADENRLIYHSRNFRRGDMRAAFLVIAATDDAELNKKISEDANQKNILVNVVDQPEFSTFIVPAVLKRGDLQIAVSTSGKSPALARHIREQLETEFGPEYKEWVRIASDFRARLKSVVPDEKARRLANEKLVESDLLDRIRAKKKIDIAGLIAKYKR